VTECLNSQFVGKGAKDGAWYLNFKIPFTKTVRVTTQTMDGSTRGGFYIIVRGGQDLPIIIDGTKIARVGILFFI
jgi:hypothetical protein